MKPDNEPVVEKVGDYLQQQSQELDQETERRLNQMRAAAVDMAAQGESSSWMAGAGFAAAFSLAVVAGFMLLNAQPEAELLPESPLELVLVNEDFEMLEHELAFYSWAESELADQG